MINLLNKKFLLILAFIEGASVMAVELLGAKMIAPFFGSSLYVWAAVLGVTLFALMIGYYLGGYVSEKAKNNRTVLWVLLLGGVLITLMPHSGRWIMIEMIDSSIQTGVTFSLLFFLMPPLILMGMTSPLIINLLNSRIDQSGKTAGLVYAISTFGGIFGTFLTGFYLLPEFGIKWPSLFFGTLLIIMPVIMLIREKFLKTAVCLIPFFVVINLNFNASNEEYSRVKLVYESEGIFGQLKVYDMPFYTILRGKKNGRLLMVNNTAQTIHDTDNPSRDLWDYSYYFPTVASVLPEGSNVLLLGLGGGALVHHFDRLKFDTDVVEIDGRLKHVAVKYFNVNPKTNIIVDDARRYLNICKKKYNLIVMDLFLNESPPAHVLTLESFRKAKGLLEKDGILIVNFFGYLSGEKGQAARSIYNTLRETGFQVEILPTPGEQEHRNLIFIAGDKLPDFNKANYVLPDLPQLADLNSLFINTKNINFSDGVILIDSKPELEKMYLSAALEWREFAIEYNLKKLIDEGFL